MQSTLATVSNKEDWTGAIYVVDADTGEAVNTSTATEIEIEVEDPRNNSRVLVGSLTGGEIVAQDATTGTYTFTFPASRTAILLPQRYRFGGIMKIDTRTVQLFRREIHVADGIVGGYPNYGY